MEEQLLAFHRLRLLRMEDIPNSQKRSQHMVALLSTEHPPRCQAHPFPVPQCSQALPHLHHTAAV